MLQPGLAVQRQIPGFRVASPVQMAAIELYQLGFNVAPTKPSMKKPFSWRILVSSRVISPDDDLDLFLRLFDHKSGIMVVTGRLSMNLTILDCETPGEAERHACEFAKRGLKPWIVETARGYHFYWLSADGELANDKDTGCSRGWEIRGNNCYILVPPSVHPTGVLYQWKSREGILPPKITMSVLDWLPLRLAARAHRKFEPRPEEDERLACLSAANRRFIENGSPTGTRNDRLFAAACDLAANGFSQNDARCLLLPACEKSRIDGSFSRADIEKTIESAFSQSREPARKTNTRFPPAWLKATGWAEQHNWVPLQGRKGKITAQTARDTFLACCERARRDASEVFRASTREISELANIDRKTAERALDCLAENGYLVRCGQNKIRAALFAFSRRVVRGTPSKGTWFSISGGTAHDAYMDVFGPHGLGKAAGRVWQAILTEPLNSREIVKRAHYHSTTVKRRLMDLEKLGLAKRINGDVWLGAAADDNRLRKIATALGTVGRSSRRRMQHSEERKQFVTRLILRAKREWEMKNLGWDEA